MKKVELLAPAGNLKCAIAAINAGADAIYLGASKYSARAFADNFTTEELIYVIRLAHIHGVAVYLALNILMTTEEFADIPDILDPLYAAGLDGLIIQDLGLAFYAKKRYPNFKLHASTQMSIMNSYGVDLMNQFGFERIVPSRELSLEEIRFIKNKHNIELECFIHGAMCYSYSGLCLMSSIIGGRSGNRGKCAGTCRLPFKYNYKNVSIDQEEYPLSMKDLCTIEIVPDLIEAGIDSFKIEGRMKSPEYVAGVTSIYRKYIDLYFQKGKENYVVKKEDIDILYSLYIRSEISKGYYEGYKGKELITIDSPSYNGSNEKVVLDINNKYISEPNKIAVNGSVYLSKGELAVMNLYNDEHAASSVGDVVENAKNQPLTEEQIYKQINKFGDSFFKLSHLDLYVDNNIFVPVGALNSLRRKSIEEIEKTIIERNGFEYIRDNIFDSEKENHNITIHNSDSISRYTIEILTYEQLMALNKYIDETKDKCLCKIQRIVLDYGLLLSSVCDDSVFSVQNLEICISLPCIYRSINDDIFIQLKKLLINSNVLYGVYVHTLDELKWLKDIAYIGKIYTDTSIYLHNKYSVDYINILKNEYQYNICGVTLPYELKLSDFYDVVETISGTELCTEMVIYGHIPLMISAGCLKKTYSMCDKKSHNNPILTDRYNHNFSVYTDCNICTNIIYNDRPLSLHNFMDKIKKLHISNYRLRFTLETNTEMINVLDSYLDKNSKFEYLNSIDTTTAHIKRGV